MQKKDSGITFLFALICLGGILAFLSQSGLRQTSASDSRLGTLDPASGERGAIESDASRSMIRGSKLLDESDGRQRTTHRCNKGPLFD